MNQSCMYKMYVGSLHVITLISLRTIILTKMNSMSCYNNHLSAPKIFFIHFTCVVLFRAKDSKIVLEQNQAVSNQSIFSNLSPQKIKKKIIEATNLNMCFKTKCQEEPSTISNKITKKINKSMQYAWKKIRHQKDDRCLWKKTILMGEKCQPLQFPGAIFYDSEGNQLSMPPKSPRFTFSHSPTLSLKKGEIQM